MHGPVRTRGDPLAAAEAERAAQRPCVRASGTLRFARGLSEVRAMEEEKYLPELMAEKDSLDPSFVHASRLLAEGRTCPHEPPAAHLTRGLFRGVKLGRDACLLPRNCPREDAGFRARSDRACSWGG